MSYPLQLMLRQTNLYGSWRQVKWRGLMGELMQTGQSTIMPGCSMGNTSMMVLMGALMQSMQQHTNPQLYQEHHLSEGAGTNLVGDIAGLLTGPAAELEDAAIDAMQLAHDYLTAHNLPLSPGKCVLLASDRQLLQNLCDTPQGKLYSAAQAHRLLGVAINLQQRRRIKLQKQRLDGAKVRYARIRRLKKHKKNAGRLVATNANLAALWGQ
eukprot:4143481-Amphidinium_carterae.1